MGGFFHTGEAIALGLASGPTCVAACGPILVPTLLAQRSGVRPMAGYLSIFLSARLLSYLLFAGAAWQLGALISIPTGPRILLTGAVNVLLGVGLIWYAIAGPTHAHACAAPKLVHIGGLRPRRIASPAALGLLTGLNLCPPFVAAGVRAAQSASMLQAMLFFALFFIGTSVWFVPFTVMGCVARNDAVLTVARMTMVLVALYYLILGISLFAGGRTYGY